MPLRVEERLLDESEWDCSMCGKHSTPKFCMICLICCSTEHFGLEFCSLRRFSDEREKIIMRLVSMRVSSSEDVGASRGPNTEWDWKTREDTTKSGEKRRTHDGHEFRRLGGVLRASRHRIPERHGGFRRDRGLDGNGCLWWSQRQENNRDARRFLTTSKTRRAYLYAAFFSPSKKKKKCAFERNTINTKTRVSEE